jgi:hypothetical protein
MQINRFGKLNEESSNNIIKKIKNDYDGMLDNIYEYLLSKGKILYSSYTIISDIYWFNDKFVEFKMKHRGNSDTTVLIQLKDDDVEELLKYVENPELYKNTHKYNL